MIERFESKKLQAKTLAVIAQANTIIAEFQAQGFVLTLRQLYYQFVARGLIANTLAEYKRLGTIIRSGRRAGLIDWDAIEDRTRGVHRLPTWDGPSDIIAAGASQYREDAWAGQRVRPEVWIEKEALAGVIEGACDEFRVPHFPVRGNNSESEQYKAGKRFAEYRKKGLTPIVLHLGDHDPNGIDMTRDNRDRLALFARHAVSVRRIALNMDQVELYRPPPNPAKETDPHYKAYVREFGRDCWELDALRPDVIVALILEQIEGLIDERAWASAMEEEASNRAVLVKAAENWALVENMLFPGRRPP
jgi:hypothetical protein